MFTNLRGIRFAGFAARIFILMIIILLAYEGLYNLPTMLFGALLVAEAISRAKPRGWLRRRTAVAVVAAAVAGVSFHWIGMWRFAAILLPAASWVLVDGFVKSLRADPRTMRTARDGIAFAAIAVGGFGFIGIPTGFGLLTMLGGVSFATLLEQENLQGAASAGTLTIGAYRERGEPQRVRCRLCRAEFFIGSTLDRCPACGETNFVVLDDLEKTNAKQPIIA